MDMNLKYLAITGLVIIVSLIFLYFTFHTRTKVPCHTREPPEPTGAWPIIGHLHQLGGANKLLHKKLGIMADKYGPAFCLRQGSRRAFVVSSWEVAKECFTIYDSTFTSRPTTTATKHMCYNNAVFGFAPYSPHWRQMRKIVMLQLFTNQRVSETIKKVQDFELDAGIRNLYAPWVKNKSLPVLVQLNHWLEDIASIVTIRMVAGKRLAAGSSELRQFQKAIAEFFRLIGTFVVSDFFPFLWWLDLQGNKKAMKKTATDLDAILGSWLNEHRQRRVLGQIRDENEQDFIDRMLLSEEEGTLLGFPYDADTSIKSTCLAIVTGGSDAMATTLTWAMSLLLNNRAALKKAQEELDRHVGIDRLVNETNLNNLVYLQAIIKETLRLCPVTLLSGPREAMEDCRVAGYHVKAGTRLVVNVWKIQRDPTVWENPLDFEPEKFLTSYVGVDAKGQHFELIPFGCGRRACPGSSFALQALNLTLAKLLHSFDLETYMDESVDMTERSGMNSAKASPLKVLLRPRLPAKLYQ